MIGELVLHLGDFRTGTTAIQRWLRTHGAALGIYYPPGFNHAPLAHCLPDPAARKQQFRALDALLAGVHARHAVISAEHFEFADPVLLAEALAEHLPRHTRRLRLIAYVRPHPQAYVARFTESARIGSFEGDLDAYLDWPQTRARMTYAPRFAAWARVFDHMFGAAFTLRLYDRGRFAGGDVLRDFAGFVTGTDPGPQDIEANPSPGVEALAYARAFHRAIGPLPEAARTARWTLGRHLGRQITDLGLPQTPVVLHRALAERLAQTFAADAAATDAAFFADDTTAGESGPLTRALQAAPGQAPEAPQSFDPADHLGPQTLQAIGLWGGMLRHALTAPGGAEMLDRVYHE